MELPTERGFGLLPDGGEFGEVALQHHDRADRDEEQQPALGHAAPGAEHACHFGFMRTFGRYLKALRAEPGLPVDDREEDRNQEVGQVEIAQAGGFEGVHQRASRIFHAQFGQSRRDRAPVENSQQIEEQNQEGDVAEGPLAEVGDHDRDLSAEDREDHAERQKEQQQKYIGADGEAEKAELLRQSAEVDEETGRYRRKNAVVQHSGQPRHETGEYPEFPAVAFLEKLGDGQHARLPQPVTDPAGGGQRQRHEAHDERPPDRGKTGLVIELELRDYGDRAEGGDAVGDSQQISPRAPVGGEKLRGVPHETLAVDQYRN